MHCYYKIPTADWPKNIVLTKSHLMAEKYLMERIKPADCSINIGLTESPSADWWKNVVLTKSRLLIGEDMLFLQDSTC